MDAMSVPLTRSPDCRYSCSSSMQYPVNSRAAQKIKMRSGVHSARSAAHSATQWGVRRERRLRGGRRVRSESGLTSVRVRVRRARVARPDVQHDVQVVL